MIKKLRNQPCAPKVGASSQVGARGIKKTHRIKEFGTKKMKLTGEIRILNKAETFIRKCPMLLVQ
jgi:hypothetical protein